MTTSSNLIDPALPRAIHAQAESDRLRRLEDEIADLRETIARFAEILIGEVKDLRHGQVAPVLHEESPEHADPSASAETGPNREPNLPRRPWLLTELVRDLTTTVRMYLDPRYRVRRSTQLLVPLIAGLFALNCVFFRAVFTVSIVSPIMEKLADIILAVLLYKVVSRELVRYRQVIAQWLSWQGQEPRSAAVVVGGEPATTRLETDSEMIRLGVNIDHVATLRQARRAKEPDPVAAAVLALLGGADGITIHLREDRRHIQDRDLEILRLTVPHGLNLEMAVAPEIVDIAYRVKPDQVTLVPERREELTTEGGLDVLGNHQAVLNAIQRLAAAEIPVALFIDPDPAQIDDSKRLGAVAVELQTATYSESMTAEAVARQLAILEKSTAHAKTQGLRVHMGHGLNYINVKPIVRIAGVEELNIGHSIVSRAVLVGMDRAVREMKEAMALHFPNPRRS